MFKAIGVGFGSFFIPNHPLVAALKKFILNLNVLEATVVLRVAEPLVFL